MEPLRFGHTLDCFAGLSQRLDVCPVRHQESAFESGLVWDGPLARGHVSQMRVRPGLEVTALDLTHTSSWALDVVHEATGFELTFTRASSMEITLAGGPALGTGADQFGICQVSTPTQLNLRSRQGANRSITVRVSPDELRNLLGAEGLPAGFSEVAASVEGLATLRRRSTVAMAAIVDDLSSCGLRGPMRRLYFESKTLELIVLAAQQLGEQAELSPALGSEIERLEQAKSLLLNELQRPPSLRQLARRCGLNERKLKEGFKSHFGTTVFGFVRQQRLSHARALLPQCSSVTEVAQTVGYANPSKFAAAFRREFGVTPSTLMA